MLNQEASRLAIGTAQFGLSYGVANRTGQVSVSDARSILEVALRAGVNTIDTAAGYGTSEQVLGSIGVGSFRVVTKLPAVPDDEEQVSEWIECSVTCSLDRLGVDRLGGVLLHRPHQLLESRGQAIWQGLLDLERKGLTEKVGYSVYGPEELDLLWDRFPPKLVQVPFNVLDRRMETSGWLQRAADDDVEVHARSAFLQGLLLMGPGERPAEFQRWSEVWARWDRWLEAREVTPLRACLSLVLSRPGISRVVIGVDSSRQLEEILDSSAPLDENVPMELASSHVELLNPSLWPKLKGTQS